MAERRDEEVSVLESIREALSDDGFMALLHATENEYREILMELATR